MARPLKVGLDYFPIDVDYHQDEKFQFIVAKCGLLGEVICIRLLAKIYRNGYFTSWTEDDSILFALNLNVELAIVNQVVNEAIKRGLFSRDMLERHSILTSHGIQARYIKACTDSRRAINPINLKFSLLSINTEETEVKPEETAINTEETQSKSAFTHDEITQRREDKIESKEDQIESEENVINSQTPFDFFLHQNEIFNQTNSEFLKSDMWFGVKAMQLMSTPENLIESAKSFVLNLRDRDMLEGKTLIDLRAHFVSWFKKNHSRQVSKAAIYIPNIEDR